MLLWKRIILSIKKKLYESLHYKKDNFDISNITINIRKNNIPKKEYIEKIKYNKFWAGDLEISETGEISRFNIIKIKKLKRVYLLHYLFIKYMIICIIIIQIGRMPDAQFPFVQFFLN